jgi:UDP-glucose 4-epimerase
MVILVTGGCGYIGSRLIRDLASDEKMAGCTIRVIDNMMRERYVALMDLPGGTDFEFLEGDIRNDADLKRSFRDVDMVVDLAGVTNAPMSFERRELTFDINVNGGRKVVEQAVRSGVERFVYSSTASVYGSTRGIVDEKYPCKPISPYGESKLQGEKACLGASKEEGLNSTVLRLGTVYGFSIGMRFDTVVDRFSYLACAGMALPVWESARTEKRPYLHVADATRALVFALNRSDMSGEIYNVVGENSSIDKITDVIRKEVPDIQILVSPSPNLNQVSYELDGSKISKIGFDALLDLNHGVKEIVDKFRALLASSSREVHQSVPVTPAPVLSEP